MTTPADEKTDPLQGQQHSHTSDEDGTLQGDDPLRNTSIASQTAPTVHSKHYPATFLDVHNLGTDQDARSQVMSPSRSREQASRLDDELKMLQVERQISTNRQSKDGDLNRQRSSNNDVLDEFDISTAPIHETAKIYRLPEHPTTAIARFLKKVHGSSFLVRYFVYILPIGLIILIPLLLGVYVFHRANVGGVHLSWFCIWLEIVWLTLWAGRILAKCLPWPIGVISSLFTNNDKKWRDMVKQLEVPATLFFWWLGIEVSFLPTMIHHQVGGNHGTKQWMTIMNKVIITFFVAAILNFIEKIIIQLIAINFHLRTYQDRIEVNQFQIGSLIKLYAFSKAKIQLDDSEFDIPSGNQPGSGARTPGAIIEKAQKNTRTAFTQFGDVAGRIAGDFTGRKVITSTHPQQVILALLATTGGSQLLARRLYRTFSREDTETVHQEELNDAFDNQDEADAAFGMFDKDLNGDISMEELEAVCVEIGRERKSITASLKDLDSVVSRLDSILLFIVFAITVLVFISLISTSAAGVLTSLGSAVLGLSWLLSATAQDFLQSIMFVFAKHPFDVGDRVRIYGNTGSNLQGDDYFVKEIGLLYTEFKKMEGNVVQAPNWYLNSLFIMNHRRSGGLAEAVPMTFKFGTTLEQIDTLRLKLLDFVTTEKREYQPKILTELVSIVEAHAITLNVIFFFKSSWQNELLRLTRRNKFICALMVAMQECGIEGPRMRNPGQTESFPMYLQHVPFEERRRGHGGHPDNPRGDFVEPEAPPFVAPLQDDDQPPSGRKPSVSPDQTFSRPRGASVLRNLSDATSYRRRGETLSAMDKRVDFSLGASSLASADEAGDVYADRMPRLRIPVSSRQPSASPAGGRRESISASRSRFSISRPRMSSDAARSTSRSNAQFFEPVRGGGLSRSATDAFPSMSAHTHTHRNRFFGRASMEGFSRAHDPEVGMVGIPESEREGAGSGAGSGSGGTPYGMGQNMMGMTGMVGANMVAADQANRIDPRTGVISPMAVRMSDESQSRGHEWGSFAREG